MCLSDPSGRILDKVVAPQLYDDVAYGRTLGQAGLFYYSQGTPGETNGMGFTGFAEPAKNTKYMPIAKAQTIMHAIKPRTGDGFFAVSFGLTGVELLPIPLPFHPAIVHLIS